MTDTVPTSIEAKGRNGATVIFDGTTVTISRKGFLGAMTAGNGDKRVPVRMITAVQYKPASAMIYGYIQFSFSGETQKNRRQQSINDRARDENTVQFTKQQMPAFDYLRDAIEFVRSQPAAPTVMQAGPSAAERIQQLAQLRAQGLISAEEYEAKRQQLLAEM